MQNSTHYRIAQPLDLELIYQYAENQLKQNISDEMEQMIAVWNSRFRKEALEHYLKLGWSFIAEHEKKECVGFFLGQPFLFFQGQTQSLWVELVQASTAEIKAELIEIAYKLARDKHIQQVLLPSDVQNDLNGKNIPLQPIKEPFLWAKTTK